MPEIMNYDDAEGACEKQGQVLASWEAGIVSISFGNLTENRLKAMAHSSVLIISNKNMHQFGVKHEIENPLLPGIWKNKNTCSPSIILISNYFVS